VGRWLDARKERTENGTRVRLSAVQTTYLCAVHLYLNDFSLPPITINVHRSIRATNSQQSLFLAITRYRINTSRYVVASGYRGLWTRLVTYRIENNALEPLLLLSLHYDRHAG